MSDTNDKTTHFGFETVPEADKAGRVQGVFNSVASKYDVMNDVMSMGIHRVWKDAMMDWLAPRARSASSGCGRWDRRYLIQVPETCRSRPSDSAGPDGADVGRRPPARRG